MKKLMSFINFNFLFLLFLISIECSYTVILKSRNIPLTNFTHDKNNHENICEPFQFSDIETLLNVTLHTSRRDIEKYYLVVFDCNLN